MTAVLKSVGISSAIIPKWRNGTIPNGSTLIKLSEYFSAPVGWFLQEEDEEENALDESRALRVPIVGEIAAGIPIDAIQNIEDYEELPPDMAAKGEYIGLLVHGDSMMPRICNGDVIIIRLQDDVENGEIAAVCVNGNSATCKRIKKSADGISLISDNPGYEPMFYTFPEVRDLPVRIVGKVIELRRKFQ